MAEEVAAARPAATIVVVRESDGGEGVEVLVLRRSPGNRFAPGFVVFPGGSIDFGDDDLAERWFGTRDERARACAVRELSEEAGLVLTAGGLVEAPLGSSDPPEPGRLSPGALPEIGHWIAPEFLPTRFDARFFAARSPRGLEPRPDAREADAAWWASPGELLDRHKAGDVLLAWPTFKTLEALAPCRTVPEALALSVEQVPPPTASHVAPRPGETA